MFGIFLISIGTLFSEITDSIGKTQERKGREDAYAMGFFNFFWAGIIFLAIILYKSHFGFSLASLPTFVPRLILEIFQTHFTVLAIIKADRSTFGFIRVLTLPLLLGADIFLGYAVSLTQVAGIVLILLILVFVFFGGKIGKQGRWLTLFTALNAVVTTSLFKYNITHHNTVEAEQFIVIAVLLIYFWVGGYIFSKQNNFVRLFTNRIFFTQSFLMALAAIAESFALLFAPASVILAGKRSSAIAWATISGKTIFSEKNLAYKLGVLAFLVIGIALLVG